MRIGDIVGVALWITGEESHELRRNIEMDLSLEIENACGPWLCGPIIFTEKKPGEDRVPPVPNHIHGNAIKLLVAEANIIAPKPVTSTGSFTANLEIKDLVRLRQITRNLIHRTQGIVLSDAECDEIIDNLGPEVALDSLRKHVKPFGLLH